VCPESGMRLDIEASWLVVHKNELSRLRTVKDGVH